ncbi:hypothetical protein MBORA_16440 [Methanobrevibacter oralis]|uniref:Uncharacterized protein n=1 Tax=Methanobrevibacter oralis TaxID=66851 RepID=A0A166C4I1_METOA|nr:hypothetical protein [Methanobrevibacter oralis]KZX11167.1 hypothetical protein MBORA_16440 [Methanobrevibacter oralis]
MRRKNDGKIVLILIFVLVAFIVGAGIGVTMGLDGGNNDKNETHIKNVTVEMTTNLNETDDAVYYDKEIDGVDFNNKEEVANLLNNSNQTQ